MLVERLTLSGFTAFSDSRMDFVPGVNVFIGANGTGKTHAMKLIYTVLRAFEDETPPHGRAPLLRAKLAGVFKPDDNSVGRLVRRVRGKGVADVEVSVDGKTYAFSIHQAAQDPVRLHSRVRATTPTSIFLPSREVLAMFEGFTSLYEAREINVDETYADAVLALGLPGLRGPRPGDLGRIARELEDAIAAKVQRDGPRFYLRERGGAKVEAHLAAEGHRKIASILQLISNGTLRERAVLFWDEPEANLNPILAEIVVDAIYSLATAGVQVFLATHDYLIANRLSLRAQESPGTRLRYFALTRNVKEGTSHETAGLLSELDENLLIDAIREHNRYQREVSVKRLSK